MYNNRFILVLGVLSLLLVTLAVSNPFPKASPQRINEATDFHQRHPEWIWTSTDQNALIPATGASDFPDYHQRHPELRMSVGVAVDLTDYFSRHPELSSSTKDALAASDYFMRHPELSAPIEVSIDTTDYFFRQPAMPTSAKTIDLTDYFFRHTVP